MIDRSFDLVVVGSGSAGSTVARACRGAGWRVAIVDSRPFGGTCALRGCDPKRVLIGAAELVDMSRRFAASGLVTSDARIDWRALMRFKHTFTDPVPVERGRTFRDAGIETFHGRAAFTDPSTLRVGETSLRARYFVIAAGAKHRALNFSGAEHLTTSTGFLDLAELPRRVIFVGGGYISFEFAHLAARAGAEARIIHGGPRPLTGFDPELVDVLVEATRAVDIAVELTTRVTAIEKEGRTLRVQATTPAGTRTFDTDLVVHGAGRVAEIDDLALDIGGIARTTRGVAVDQFLQSTSNPSVYAAGDAADDGGLALTPVAAAHGEIVADNLIHGNRRTFDASGLATIVYTIPPLAHVGISESQAKGRGLRARVLSGDSASWFSSRRLAARRAAYKLVLDGDSDRVLGATLLGPHTEELANVFALAIRANVSSAELRSVLFAYPTASSDIEYMLEA